MSQKIKVQSRTTTAEERSIDAEQAPKILRDTDEALRKFEAEAATERARLEAERNAALSLQEQYDGMLSERESLEKLVARAKNDIAANESRVADCKAEACWKWQAGGMTADHQVEWNNRSFVLLILTEQLPKWEARSAELDKAIAAFKRTHSIK